MTATAVGPRPSSARLLVLALQHVLVMYTGNVTVPLLVARAIKLSPDQTALLINADLFAAGIATLIQTLFGARLPIMMGATFLSVAPAIAMGSDPTIGLRGFYGAVIVSGVLGVIAAPLIGRAAAIFPAVVSGSIITLIGLSLMPVAFNWVGGGNAASSSYGSLPRLALALVVFLITVLMTRFGRGIGQTLAILIAIFSGSVLAAAFGEFHVEGVADAHWIAFVIPFQFGAPVFQLVPILIMSLVMAITLVESTGVILALARVTNRKLGQRELVQALRADGVGILAGGIFNAFPYTSFSQNVGLVGITGVSSPYVCAVAGVFLIFLGLLPKLAHVVAAVPSSVLGGAGIVMFGLVAATGIRVLGEADLGSSPRNQFIVASSLGFGSIPTLAPQLLQQLPRWAAPVTGSGVVLGAMVGISLNLLFNGVSGARSGKARLSEQSEFGGL